MEERVKWVFFCLFGRPLLGVATHYITLPFNLWFLNEIACNINVVVFYRTT